MLSAAEAKWHRIDISAEFEGGEILDNCPYSTYRGYEFAPDRELLLGELKAELLSSLRSERDRRFLTWKFEDLDADEMARREGISLKNVYMVLFHMRERLRRVA